MTVHYTGRLEDGTVFDTSRDKEPITVPLGRKRVIEGFEEALEGMEVGEKKRVTIPPPKAYGPHRGELVTQVERGRFPKDLELREGQRLQIKNSAGLVTTVRVVSLGQDSVTVDANHPLAGKTLVFDLEIVGIS
jgi:peptidylprolyl isomerase/FKBP-type peptidyl-prolyl cis-trans isomerase SlpA